MNINVKEWLAMHPVKRYIKLQEEAYRQNDDSLKRHKKSSQARQCE